MWVTNTTVNHNQHMNHNQMPLGWIRYYPENAITLLMDAMKVQGEEAKDKIQLPFDSLTRSLEEESYDADLTLQQHVPFQSQKGQATVTNKPYQSKNLMIQLTWP